MRPPKPASRPRRVSLWRYMRLFQRDILSAQPGHLYRAWMAEFRTPFFRSYLINDPALVKEVLADRPRDFPKSDRVGEGLRPLLGNSIFLSNGATWERQRRIIDPAFEGGRLREVFGAMRAAGEAAVARTGAGETEIERITSHAAADIVFRTLFSLPIEDRVAGQVFAAFQTYQRVQPLLNAAAFMRLPGWAPRGHRRTAKAAAREIRHLIRKLVAARLAEIEAGTAPDDLATRIMTTPDPETGACFTIDEMVDQVAIFFLAGHETSASALAWSLYLCALHPDAQDRVAQEAQAFMTDPGFANLSTLKFTRDVFRETLRLYPPVPMMVRETTRPETFRKRPVRRGSQIVISPWHLHRQTRIWPEPDAFDPDRWSDPENQGCARDAYIPFSSGRRACPGAGFAMIEGPLLLAQLVAAFRFDRLPGSDPVPVAHLTVRARNGIWLKLTPRGGHRDGTPELEHHPFNLQHIRQP